MDSVSRLPFEISGRNVLGVPAADHQALELTKTLMEALPGIEHERDESLGELFPDAFSRPLRLCSGDPSEELASKNLMDLRARVNRGPRGGGETMPRARRTRSDLQAHDNVG